GNYTVQLTVTGSNGQTNTSVRTDFIHVLTTPPPPPTLEANFTANETEGPIPFAVQFYDNSTGNVTAWSWKFGDGNTSSVQNPVHVYSKPGLYTVNLTVTNAMGNTDSRTRTDFVQAVPPLPRAMFTSNVTNGTAPLPVQFNSTSTGNVVGWSWRFGDGNTSTLENPVHTYEEADNYTVRLTVLESNGRTNTTVKNDYIHVLSAPKPTAPVANFTTNTTRGPVPLAVQFNSTSSGSITAWNWSFGDGNTSSLQNLTHTYEKAGRYTVNLTVTDAAGRNDTINRPDLIMVLPSPGTPLRAQFTSNVTRGPVPLAVQFNSTSTGTVVAWNWSFGDGTNSSVQNPVHTYNTSGTYIVMLNVTGSNGRTTETTNRVIATPSTVMVPGRTA
ncbi:MAG TPA: PKD domain-containing protein, partial [Methanomicrobiales archaeon]|nr:PKD domain-containing protein [Methanomicrobiales archaeon]